MVEDYFLRLMGSYATIGSSDVVLEVGAGFGFLTQYLAEQSKRVIAVEADPRLVDALKKELEGCSNIGFVEGDILKVRIPLFNKVVSNPPFSISSPLLFWLFDKSFEVAVLTFQREFAGRLNASIGSKDYSRLTVSTYWNAEVELLDVVPRKSFYPSPDVDATIVRLRPKKSSPCKLDDERVFSHVVRTLFTQRNKKVRTAIQPFLAKSGISTKPDSLPFHSKRVRELAPEEFGIIANELSS
jgi:16S rRNA (adenine1518-N6/adenine1519-N6)-dimethyltransferase